MGPTSQRRLVKQGAMSLTPAKSSLLMQSHIPKKKKEEQKSFSCTCVAGTRHRSVTVCEAPQRPKRCVFAFVECSLAVSAGSQPCFISVYQVAMHTHKTKTSAVPQVHSVSQKSLRTVVVQSQQTKGGRASHFNLRLRSRQVAYHYCLSRCFTC